MTAEPLSRTDNIRQLSLASPGSIPLSRPVSICSEDDEHLDYFAYVPAGADGNAPLLVSLHGLKRNAAQHVFMFARFAEQYGISLLAPLFPKNRFRYFQTLSPNEQGEFPERIFERTIRNFAERSGTHSSQRYLFGYSGGGQFAHRYALLGGGMVDKIALMAPGWFTLPDPSLPYPYGIGPSELLGQRNICLKHALQMPTLVIVGERDRARRRSLNTDALIDESQGRHRLQRCRNWVTQMQAQASGCGVADLRTLPEGRHNFVKNIKQDGLGELLFEWLLNEEGS